MILVFMSGERWRLAAVAQSTLKLEGLETVWRAWRDSRVYITMYDRFEYVHTEGTSVYSLIRRTFV